MDANFRFRPVREQKPSVQPYLIHCLKEHKRRLELFSQRWIGADYFHEYLSTIEPYSSVLASDMEYLIKVYFQKGRNEFKNFDHAGKSLEKRRLSELLSKYIIEEKAEKSGFQIGILELVRVHPFQIAHELRFSRASPVGELDKLPKCLAFSGGIHLVPETEVWEPMAISWKIWKSSVERLSSEDLSHMEEYVNLHYRIPTYTDRKKSMEALDVQPLCASQVLPILRKNMRDFIGSSEPQDPEMAYCLEALFPCFYESIYNFYVKHFAVTSTKRNRRKAIAATFSSRPVRTSDSVVQSLRSYFRFGKQNSASSSSKPVASARLAADLKIQRRTVCEKLKIVDDPETYRTRRAMPSDTEEHQNPENTKSVPWGSKKKAALLSQQDTVSSNPLLQRNLSERQMNETVDPGTPSVMFVCQTSRLGESHSASSDSPEISSASRNSVGDPVLFTACNSSGSSQTELERKTMGKQQDRNENTFPETREAHGFRRSGTVPKRSAPKKVVELLSASGSLNQRVNKLPLCKEVDLPKFCRKTELSSLSAKGRDTLQRNQSKKAKTKEYPFKR